MTRPIDTLLLLALPASGKSEIRRYLASLDPLRALLEFGLDRPVQLDDYPYVHLMRRISDELIRRGGPAVFFASADTPFLESGDWVTLIHLINEDHAELGRPSSPEPESAAGWLFDRFERARRAAGLGSPLAGVPDGLRSDLAGAVEADARSLWTDRQQTHVAYDPGATVVIEFARGGPEGARLPLAPPYGYRYSLGRLSPELLASSSILYVWVTPEESRRRNVARAHPGIEGDASILHHGVPEAVMRSDYGTDDLLWLIGASDRPGTVRIEAHGSAFYLPVTVFDNRPDHTSFLRDDPATWARDAVEALHSELVEVFGRLRGAPSAP